MPRGARSTAVKRNAQGKLVSKRSKTGDSACSAAMSAWKTTGMTPAIAAVLGKCRAKARAMGQASTQRAVGNEGRAQALESRIARDKPLTQKARLARAKELRAQRAGNSSPKAANSSQSGDLLRNNSSRKPRNKAEREVAAMGGAREARLRRYGERSSMGKVPAKDVEARDVVMLAKARANIAASKKERRAEQWASRTPGASSSSSSGLGATSTMPASISGPSARGNRRVEGVPVRDWDGTVIRREPFAEAVTRRRSELQQRRQSRAENRAAVARENRLQRLGAMLPESRSAEARSRLARAAELRAQRASGGAKVGAAAPRAMAPGRGTEDRLALARKLRESRRPYYLGDRAMEAPPKSHFRKIAEGKIPGIAASKEEAATWTGRTVVVDTPRINEGFLRSQYNVDRSKVNRSVYRAGKPVKVKEGWTVRLESRMQGQNPTNLSRVSQSTMEGTMYAGKKIREIRARRAR